MSEQAWLLYFEKGTNLPGGAVRDAQTLYVGTYDSKAAALRNAVRAMDTHSEPPEAWRTKDLWTRREDRRLEVGDKGTVISVSNDDGAYFQTKIRMVPWNKELPQCGSEEGFWA